MKRLLTAATIGLVALAMAASSNAAPPSPAVAALQRRVTSDTRRIHNLQERRTYLHHYIRGLRRKLHPAPVTHTTTSASVSSSATYISPTALASLMQSAGFPDSVIPYFLNTIIPRESGFCPTAVYPGHCGDASLFIAGGPACSIVQLFPCPGPQAADPATALALAYQKYAASGLAPWS